MYNATYPCHFDLCCCLIQSCPLHSPESHSIILFQPSSWIVLSYCGLMVTKKNQLELQLPTIRTPVYSIADFHLKNALIRLLVASAKESGAWLQTLLIASQGQTMNDAIIKIAVSICLDYILCDPHTSQQHHHQQKSFQKQQQRSGGAIVIISLKKIFF